MNLPKFLTSPNPEIYLGDNYVVLDFETTNIDKGSPYEKANRIIFSGWILGRDHPDAERKGKSFSRWGSEYELGELVKDCEQADFIVAQNAKFELGWLERAGLDLTKVLPYDTMLGEYVLAGNRKWDLDLDSIAKRYGLPVKNTLVKSMMSGGVCPSEIPKSLLETYGMLDVIVTRDLFLKQREVLYNNGLLPSLFTRCIFTPVLTDIEKNGMFLDSERVRSVYKKVKDEYDEIESELHTFTGGINTRSPKQVAEYLYDKLGFEELRDRRGEPVRTATGTRKADKETISLLKSKTKEQRDFLKLKKRQTVLNADLTKTLTKFKQCVEKEESPVLTAQFNQTITRTHRLSSSGKKYKVQFQNFPRKFKPLFTTRNDGWSIGEIDGAQLEFRVAAFLGQDEVAMQDIKDHFDVHSFTASILNDVTLDWMLDNKKKDKKAKEFRQGAKADTFKPLYGGQSGTKKQVKYYTAFKEKYRGIAETQEEWKQEVLYTKKLITATGLIFYWPDTRMSRTGYITNSTAICNYPVQSLATADIIPIAVTYQWHRMKLAELKSFLVNTIHDSSIGEVHPDEKEKYKEIGELSFTDDVYYYMREVYGIDFNVELEAEAEFNVNWADNDDWKNEWLN